MIAPRRRSACTALRAACALLAAVALAGSAVAAATMARCDSSTPLTLVGVDVKEGRALFAPPVRSGEPGWLIELDAQADTATAWPEPNPGARFGGSTGPGAVIAASRCGAQCLQMLRFTGGTWRPLGEPLLASSTNTVHATWDADGNAWVVLHGAPGPTGIAAQAYRLRGRQWMSMGSLSVAGVGSPGALVAPPGESGIVSGDAQFTADGHPRRWRIGPPSPSLAHGELLWLGGEHAALIGADTQLAVTDDGRTWQQVRWLPWTGGEGDLAWKPGRDFWVELPDGDREPPLVAVWNDARVAAKSRIFLAHRDAIGAWRSDLAVPQGILTAGGERLPFNHMLRLPGERWLLITGCVARADGAALALRRVEGGVLRDPELVPIHVATP